MSFDSLLPLTKMLANNEAGVNTVKAGNTNAPSQGRINIASGEDFPHEHLMETENGREKVAA